MEKMNKDMKIEHMKVSIAKLNTKRFSRFRYNLFLNFISIVIIFQSLRINNLFHNFGLLAVFLLEVVISIVMQGWAYYTKLDLYSHKFTFNKGYLRLYWYREIFSVALSVLIVLISKNNNAGNLLYLSVNILISLINVSIYLWIQNKFLNGNDKYFVAIKNAYLSLPKSHR